MDDQVIIASFAWEQATKALLEMSCERIVNAYNCEQLPPSCRPLLERVLDMKKKMSAVIPVSPSTLLGQQPSSSTVPESHCPDSLVKHRKSIPVTLCTNTLFRQEHSSSASFTVPESGSPDPSVEQAHIPRIYLNLRTQGRPSYSTESVTKSSRKRGPGDFLLPVTKRLLIEPELPDLYAIENSELDKLVSTPRCEDAYPENKGERVEFFGDSILHFVLSKLLYNEFPSATEGELSIMRSLLERNSTLSEFAQMYDMDYLIDQGREIDQKMGRSARYHKRLADCFEVYVGALYLDKDMESVTEFITRLVTPIIADIRSLEPVNAKARYQLESIFGARRNALVFHVVGDPSSLFPYTVECRLERDVIGKGHGLLRRDAELRAAMDALTRELP
jgi:ribonuclease-3